MDRAAQHAHAAATDGGNALKCGVSVDNADCTAACVTSQQGVRYGTWSDQMGPLEEKGCGGVGS